MPNELTGQPEEHEIHADEVAREEETARWAGEPRTSYDAGEFTSHLRPDTYRADDFTDVLRLPYLGCSRRRLTDEERARYG